MVSSQDAAIAAALTRARLRGQARSSRCSTSTTDCPADGKLEVRDVLIVGRRHRRSTTAEDVARRCDARRRDSRDLRRPPRRQASDGRRSRPSRGRRRAADRHRAWAAASTSRSRCRVDIDADIGGPERRADVLPGDLRHPHAGLADRRRDRRRHRRPSTHDGKVGPIGGIQQKIAARRDAGAELFLVPPDNCADALGARHGDMRLVRADHHARRRAGASRRGSTTPTPTLPSCEDAAD